MPKHVLNQPRQFSLDVILTNRPRSFQKTVAITTGLNDNHEIIITTFRSSNTAKPPRNTIYRITKILMPKIC